MSGSHNEQTRLDEMRNAPLAVAATATLTVKEILENSVFAPANGVALTLPAAAVCMTGCLRWILCPGAAATVVVAAGFAGGNDTCTLAAGEMIAVYCDGDYWYECHNEPAA